MGASFPVALGRDRQVTTNQQTRCRHYWVLFQVTIPISTCMMSCFYLVLVCVASLCRYLFDRHSWIFFSFSQQITTEVILFNYLNMITVMLSVISSSTALIHLIVGPGEYDPKGVIINSFFFTIYVFPSGLFIVFINFLVFCLDLAVCHSLLRCFLWGFFLLPPSLPLHLR